MRRVFVALMVAFAFCLIGCSSGGTPARPMENRSISADEEPEVAERSEEGPQEDISKNETLGMSLADAKKHCDETLLAVFIKQDNGTFRELTDYGTVPGFTAIQLDVDESFVFAKENDATVPVIDRARDTLVLVSKDRPSSFRRVTEEGWGCLEGMSANDSNSFAGSDGPATIGGIQINASDDFGEYLAARDGALEANGVHFRNGFMVGEKGTHVVYGWYADVDYREFAYVIDDKYFAYADDAVDLQETVTQEGYFLLDASSIEPGRYVLGGKYLVEVV